MKKGLFFLLLAGVLFSGCAEKNDMTQNPKDYKTTDEVLGGLNNLNKSTDLNTKKEPKTNTYIVKNPSKSSSLRTQPKIMETLFLGYVDEKDNRISDYYVESVIDFGEWVGKNGSKKAPKNLGGLNE